MRTALILLLATPLIAQHSPPAGLYRCWAGGFAHLPAGTLTLSANGHYESYRHGGGGEYTFTPAISTIEFRSGDYHYWEYKGLFQPADRNRIVLIPLDANHPVGTERPGEYQYCYPDSTKDLPTSTPLRLTDR